MRVLSWNVNGLRACVKKGFLSWLEASGADVVGIQELRATPEQLPPELTELSGWHAYYQPAARAGYSGVALFCRRPCDAITTSLDDPEIDSEGRLQIAHFGPLQIVNGYFPNGNGKERDNSRIPFKLRFYQRLFNQLEPARRAGAPILVMGDFNTAHREIDLARPRENEKTSGFTPIERAELDRWLCNGWTDSFRQFQKEGGHYSWWSSRGGARERNVGWRLDYVLCSPGAQVALEEAFIQPNVLGSDHCPVGVRLDPSRWVSGPT